MNNLSIQDTLKIIDFPVEKREVFLTDGKLIPRKKAIVRTDNGNVLSIVSSQYQLIRNGSIFKIPLETISDSGFFINRVSVNLAGAETMVEMLSEKDYEIPNGSKTELFKQRLILNNSYNCVSAFRIIFGSWRLICSNGAGIWKEKQDYRVIHMGSLNEEKKIVNQIYTVLLNFKGVFSNYLRDVEELQESPSSEIWESLKKEGFGKNIIKNIYQRIDNSKLSYLDIYNAYTEYCRDIEAKKQMILGSYVYFTAKMMRILLTIRRMNLTRP